MDVWLQSALSQQGCYISMWIGSINKNQAGDGLGELGGGGGTKSVDKNNQEAQQE